MAATMSSNGAYPPPTLSTAPSTASLADGLSRPSTAVDGHSRPTTASTAAAAPSASTSAASKKQSISYEAERVIGTGSFGVVYQAIAVSTGEVCAIKKVLQDRRFKNRELQILSTLHHVNVVGLKHCFYSREPTKTRGAAGSNGNGEDLYLNLVMDFIPSTLHRSLRDHTKAQRLLPMFLTRLYMWQLCRAVAYIHSLGVCHRDLKPQNLLLNPRTHELKLCDFGSAKVLNPREPNVSYICSRYYRAPELVFEATVYTPAIDSWSVGCVFGEMLLGSPLFPGESSVDQLIEIIKVLGTPTKEEIFAMNPHNTSFKFPQIKAASYSKVFRGKAPSDALDLISRFLRYDPTQRIHPLDALAHEFFDPLRVTHAGRADLAGTNKDVILPATLFQFTLGELRLMAQRGTMERIVPLHMLPEVKMQMQQAELQAQQQALLLQQQQAMQQSPTQ